jgi:hypothetical protein
MSSEEAKDKGEKFSELAKRNTLHHHMGMTPLRGRSGSGKKGRQLQPGRRICLKASMRGHVTSSMPVGRRS